MNPTTIRIRGYHLDGYGHVNTSSCRFCKAT